MPSPKTSFGAASPAPEMNRGQMNLIAGDCNIKRLQNERLRLRRRNILSTPRHQGVVQRGVRGAYAAIVLPDQIALAAVNILTYGLAGKVFNTSRLMLNISNSCIDICFSSVDDFAGRHVTINDMHGMRQLVK